MTTLLAQLERIYAFVVTRDGLIARDVIMKKPAPSIIKLIHMPVKKLGSCSVPGILIMCKFFFSSLQYSKNVFGLTVTTTSLQEINSKLNNRAKECGRIG